MDSLKRRKTRFREILLLHFKKGIYGVVSTIDLFTSQDI